MSSGFEVNYNSKDLSNANYPSVDKLTDLLYNTLKQTLNDQEFNPYNDILQRKEQEDTNYLRNLLGSNISKQIYLDNYSSLISNKHFTSQASSDDERHLIVNKIIRVCFDYPLAKLKKIYSIIKSVININSENKDSICKQSNCETIRQVDNIKMEDNYLNKKHSLNSISLLETDNTSNNNYIKSRINTSKDKKSLIKTVSFNNYTSESRNNTLKQQKSNINFNISNEKINSLLNINNFNPSKIIKPDPTDKTLLTNNKVAYKSKTDVFLFDPITIEKYSQKFKNE